LTHTLLDECKRLKAIADIGLLYATTDYDRERYAELRDISLSLLSKATGQTKDVLIEQFPLEKEYPTAKVDIRGLIIDNDFKILLVKESLDHKWSLPGGWADVGQSPKEVIIKECKEETGLDVAPQKLLAVFDKRMHPHPPQPFYVYKMIFYCKAITSQIVNGFDILDAGFFALEDLPPLSESRILKSQLDILLKKIKAADFEAYFD